MSGSGKKINRKIINVAPPFEQMEVCLFDGCLIPCTHVNDMMSFTYSAVDRFLKKHYPSTIVIALSDKYKGRNGQTVKYLCTLAGIRIFLEQHKKWTKEQIRKAMSQFSTDDDIIFGSVEEEEEEESSSLLSPIKEKTISKKKVSFEEEKEEEEYVPVPRKRDRSVEEEEAQPSNVLDIFKKLGADLLSQQENFLKQVRAEQLRFLKSAKEHIGQEAIYAASKSKEYQEKLDQSIQKRVDAVEVIVRKEMEPKIRESLLKKIRTEEENKLREQVLVEMDDLGRSLRTQGANQIFSFSLEKQSNDTFLETDTKRASELAKSYFSK
jgi:hypothetical protein